jgi:hypothetical protein
MAMMRNFEFMACSAKEENEVAFCCLNRRSWGIAPLILTLGTRRMWVVNFIPRVLYPRETNPLSIE